MIDVLKAFSLFFFGVGCMLLGMVVGELPGMIVGGVVGIVLTKWALK